MTRLRIAFALCCSVFLLVSCGNLPTSPGPEETPGPARGNPPPPPPPPPQDLGTQWRLTAKVTSIAGADSSCLDRLGFAEEHNVFTRVSGETISIVVDNNGFQMLPEDFGGEIDGRDFRVAASPNGFFDTAQCPDGTIIRATSVEVTGEISKDEREFTAAMRERWGRSSDSHDTVVTWTWTAVRR